MSAANTSEFFVGLDAGSSKVLCVAARRTGEEISDEELAENPLAGLQIEGFGSVASAGIHGGTVDDVGLACKSIQGALEEAQLTLGPSRPIARVWASIGGRTLESISCTGIAALLGREVTTRDVDAAEANARMHALQAGEGRSLLKLIPQGFACDGERAPKTPLGMAGKRLEAYVHAVYGSVKSAENLRRCISRAGVELVGYEPNVWAASRACLTADEKRCGVLLIDFGAETTSFEVFINGMCVHTFVRPWGAERITRDIAVVTGESLKHAEEAKLRDGSCFLEGRNPDLLVSCAGSGRGIRRQIFVDTIHARASELLKIHFNDLARLPCWPQVGIVVLTGGGACLRGIEGVARRIFSGKAVRLGLPLGLKDAPLLEERPDVSVALGLVRCAVDAHERKEPRYGLGPLPGFFQRIKTAFLGDY